MAESGAQQAFLKLKEAYPSVCLVHLYALEGAIHNVEFNSLPEDRKRELKEFSDFLKEERCHAGEQTGENGGFL